jgi:hypothetical protein
VTKLHQIKRAALPLHANLSIAGAHCALSTNSEEIVAATSRWRYAAHGRNDRTFDLEILLDPSLPSERDFKTQTNFRGLHHLVFATIGSHELFTFDLARRRVVGAVSATSAADANFWNAHWLPITIGVMGTTVGVTPMHSACLDLNGRGLLLAGVSGAGKSTLTVALAKAGFSPISDDWTYVSRDQDSRSSRNSSKLTAHGLNAPIKLLPDAVRHFPELSNRNPKMWFNGELAFELNPEEICGVPPQSTAHPHWLLILERTSQPGCDFSPLTPDVVRAFFESNAERLPLELPELSAERSASIESVANCSAWRVRSGDSPQATAESIRRFCERNCT